MLVDIDQSGRATRLRGNPDHPTTQGYLCAKVTRYLDRVYDPERLLHPLRRTAGGFERVRWDEAIDAIAGRLHAIAAQFGAEAILPYSYAGTMGLLNNAGMDRRFFHRLGASRLDRTICASAGAAGLTEAIGARIGTDFRDFAHSKLIIAWGANILATNVHLWPYIVQARREGARLVVIDPVRTKTAALADQHLAVYPGSDLALALGLIHVILRDALEDQDYIDQYTSGIASLRERAAGYPPARVALLTGIPAAEIEQLARDYATTRPAAIRLNYGVQRSERGGKAVRAIALLPALTGSWRERGGGLLLTSSGGFQLNRDSLERPDLQPQPTRLVNMSLLGDALTRLDDPPVKALIVYNSNPAAIAPDQARVREGLNRPDLFTVVLEQFMTDTANHADYVLPVTTFLEHTDIYTSYGHSDLQLARPALAPPGEARSNVEIFRALALRMGFTDACFTESGDDMIRGLLDGPSPFIEGISLERLEEENFLRLNVPRLPFAEGGFGTPSGLCDLSGDTLDYTPPAESRLGESARDGRYPLELISHKHANGMNSTFGNRADVDLESATIDLHPADAAPRGIVHGAPVEVFNDRGALRLVARVGDMVRPGVVRAASVRWGDNVNMLISQRLTDIGGGPTFFNCLVDVRPCSE
jgi:anaerobic selenocysteine-containing dehydrogenase